MYLHMPTPLRLSSQRKFSLGQSLGRVEGSVVFWSAQGTSCTQAEPADFNQTPHTAASESSGFCAYEHKTSCCDPDGINRVVSLFLIVRSSLFNSSKDDLQIKPLGGQGSCSVCTAISTAGSQATNGLQGYVCTIVLAQTSFFLVSQTSQLSTTPTQRFLLWPSQEHEVSSHLV